MKQCSKCGAANTDDAKNCTNCGETLTTQQISNVPQTPDINSWGEAIVICFKKYATFKGRATNAEFWGVFGFCLLVSILTSLPLYIWKDSMFSLVSAIIVLLFLLATFIPRIAVSVRRLHDTGKSGWWYLINFIPYIGGFILLILLGQASEDEDNKYGSYVYGSNNVAY